MNGGEVPRPLIVAHRGSSTEAEENTLEAFRLAIDHGADMIECDVRRTRDGRIIVHHDPAVLSHTIRSSDFRDVLSHGRAIGRDIPLLEQVLRLCHGRIALDLELKEPGYEMDILNLVDRFFPGGRCVFSSFSRIAVDRIRRNQPSRLTGNIYKKRGSIPPFIARRLLEHRLGTSIRHGDRWIFLQVDLLPFLPPDSLPRDQVKVAVWTVNSPSLIEQLMGDGRISAIVTDDPGLALACRRQRQEDPPF